MDRREFLKSAAALAGAAGLGPWDQGTPAEEKAAEKSRVVEVIHPGWRDADQNPQEKAIREMVDEAVRQLGRAADARSAWQQLFQPGEKVGLKFNRVTGNFRGVDPVIARAITASLVDAGLSARQIYVVEVPDPTLNGWTDFSPGPETYEVGGPEPTHLTNFVLSLDAIINIPNLKDHDRVGVTGALKNISHSHSIMTTPPQRYHEPVVGEVVCQMNRIPALRQKLRLHLMNGLFGVYESGPVVRPNYLFWRHSFFASFDPLAMDWIELELVEEQRQARGLPSLWTLARNPGCLNRAAELGLGATSLEQVEWETVKA